MKRWLPVVFIALLGACKDKTIDLSGDVPIKPADFLSAFPLVSGSYTAADSNINKLGDTMAIGYKGMQQFFPDSALKQVTGGDTRQIIRPVARIEKDKETYLLAKFINRKKAIRLGVFVLDKKNKFLASKELLNTGIADGYTHAVAINREPTFVLIREKMLPDNNLQFSRTAWVYNNAGFFMVVMNDSNEDTRKLALVNPLDTLPRKRKYSGDYARDKKNFISIRDSKNPNTYLFFVHFEKPEGCTGELKGEMIMKSADAGQYFGKGDPCIIDFHFDGSEITLKETGTCGNHRGMKCFFDDSFVRKKELRKKK
ncbi:MAG: hypothetical protein JO301_00425 [Chitinophagaceae bacterium]|nr:hypothetical protein [Chitinophagaceae bacterium]